jgi:putative signal transducing protein
MTTFIILGIILLGAFIVWLWPSPADEGEQDTLQTVFRTGDPGQVAFIKSLLDDAEIPFSVKGEGIQDLLGIGRLGAGYNMITGPVEFQVPSSYFKEAQDLLREMESELGHS